MQVGHQTRNKGSKAWNTCTNYQDHVCKQAKKEKNKINTTFGWNTLKKKYIISLSLNVQYVDNNSS